MRRKAAVVGAVSFLCCLCLCCCVLGELFKLAKDSAAGSYELSDGLSCREAAMIIERDREDDVTAANMIGAEREKEGADDGAEERLADKVLFWKQETGQSVKNAEFNRSGEAEVYLICGDSSVLWQDAYPLEWTDKEGCLVGDKLADALFGSRGVIGEEVMWQEKMFQIRGILKDSKAFAAEAEEETVFSHVTVCGEEEMEKERLMQRLEDACGARGERIDAPLFSKKNMPGKVSDLTGWKEYFAEQWKLIKG